MYGILYSEVKKNKNKGADIMYKKIVQDTLKNGGYTYSIQDGRYSVGTGKKSVIISKENFNENTLKNAVRELRAIDFGTWLNEDEIHVDNVTVFHEYETAYNTAKERGEIAIYDLKENKEIFIDYES